MRLITVAGPPSSGKTSVILRLADVLREKNQRTGVVKFDCLTSFDHERYTEYGIPVQVGFAGKFCPDHFFISNIEDAVRWGRREGFDILITESAGLSATAAPRTSAEYSQSASSTTSPACTLPAKSGRC
ncbi:MAG TPA: hypothetical protein O0X38_04635 [Methanocorpusculum sp.]|nr:hypothetical protein [Methanocorpusculum sp.]